LIGLNVPASAHCEPYKSDRHQDGAGYDHPMWISHLGIPSSPSSRSFEPHNIPRGACGTRPPAIMSAVSEIVCPQADLLKRQPYGGAQAGATTQMA
jgi:hypothetical protein